MLADQGGDLLQINPPLGHAHLTPVALVEFLTRVRNCLFDIFRRGISDTGEDFSRRGIHQPKIFPGSRTDKLAVDQQIELLFLNR